MIDTEYKIWHARACAGYVGDNVPENGHPWCSESDRQAATDRRHSAFAGGGCGPVSLTRTVPARVVRA